MIIPAGGLITRARPGNVPVLHSAVQYTGASAHQTTDIYETDANHRGAICVVVLHAGGWLDSVDNTINGAVEVSLQLAASGFCVFNGNYRGFGAPGFNRNTPEQDAAALMTFVRANALTYGGDPARVVIMGHSAGGQIGGMLAVTGTVGGTRPDAIMTWSAPLKIRRCVATGAEANAQNYIGLAYVGNESTWWTKEPGFIATVPTCPWLVVGSANENTGAGQAGVVWAQQTDFIADMLANTGQVIELFEFTAPPFSDDTVHYRFTAKLVNDVVYTWKAIAWYHSKLGA